MFVVCCLLFVGCWVVVEHTKYPHRQRVYTTSHFAPNFAHKFMRLHLQDGPNASHQNVMNVVHVTGVEPIGITSVEPISYQQNLYSSSMYE